jgi:hypothetical protein
MVQIKEIYWKKKLHRIAVRDAFIAHQLIAWTCGIMFARGIRKNSNLLGNHCLEALSTLLIPVPNVQNNDRDRQRSAHQRANMQVQKKRPHRDNHEDHGDFSISQMLRLRSFGKDFFAVFRTTSLYPLQILCVSKTMTHHILLCPKSVYLG